MKSKKKIALLGGDLRQYAAAEQLSRGIWNVEMWGMDRTEREENGIVFASDWEDAVSDAVGVVLPLPISIDGSVLNCPFDSSDTHLRLNDLLAALRSSSVVIGGKISEPFVKNAEAKGICVRDYFASEEFQIENAYITAEAAISIAMNSLNKNLRDATVAVTGYGRIAKHLVRLLSVLGSSVTVAARKESDLVWARSCGCTGISLQDPSSLERLTQGYDVIYNTVPQWLFDRHFLEHTSSSTFLIDLASAPGGVDICAAKELGSNVLWATSLPGKYAPVSAGHLIASCVDRILREEESPS